jgi:1,4-dihydroxy-2-naphthoyl-CoA hydrolase
MNYKQTDFSKFGADCFPGFVGIEVLQVEKNFAIARMEIKNFHFAPNGYLHAGSIVTLADTIAGYACLYNLPDKGISFTTIELKSNFLGAMKNGSVKAEANLQHSGKTTQVWDVTVTNEENEKKVALFRCTQLILY